MIRSIFLFLFSITTINLYSQCDVTSGLLHRWEFDGNGTDMIAANTASTFSYPFSTDRFNKSSKSFEINSAFGVTPIATPIVYQPFTDYTFSFWINIPYYQTQSGVFFTQESGFVAFTGCADNPNVAGNDQTFYLYNGSSVVYASGASIEYNKWYFISYTREFDSTTLYINGVKRAKHANHTTHTTINNLIGKASVQNGKIAKYDDFRVYDNLLSPSQLLNMYEKGIVNIRQQPLNISLCSGGTNSLVVKSNVAASTYQWYKNNVAVAGATDSVLSFPTYTNADTGNYFVIVNNGCRNDTSTVAKVSIGGFNYAFGLVEYLGFTSGYGNFTPVNPVGGIDGNGVNGADRFGNQATALTVLTKTSGLQRSTAFADSTSTLMCWYLYNSNTTTGATAYSSIFGSNSKNGAMPYYAPLVINPSGVLGFTKNNAFTSSGFTLTNGAYYHLAVTFTGNTYRLFVNGIKVFETTNGYNLSTFSMNRVGGNGDYGAGGSNTPMMGAMGRYDELRFYNYPLSENNIYDIFSEVVLPGNAAFVYYCDSTNVNLGIGVQSSDSLFSNNLQWYKDGVALINNAHTSGVNTNALTINNFTGIVDSGTYVLQANKNCVLYSSNNRVVKTGNLSVSNFVTTTRQSLCNAQASAIGYTISGTSNTTMYISGPNLAGVVAATPNPYTNLVTGDYVLYAISNSSCTTKKYTTILPPLNGNVIASYNSPVYSGDSLKLTSNAALYINTSSTNGWGGPAGTSTGANYNLANATSAMSGVYTVTVTNGSGCTLSTTVNVVVSPAVVLNAKVFLSGPYSTSTGMMHDSLRSKNLIPLTEPYSTVAYNTVFTHLTGGGGETMSPSVLTVTGNNAIVDWVFLELRSSSNNATVVATKSALVQRDGDIVDVNGTSPIRFSTISPNNYFVSVRHRNHLGILTKNTFALGETSPLIDFTSSATPLYRRTVNNNNFVYSSTQDSCTRKLGTTTIVRALYAGNTNLATTGVPAQYRQIKYNGVGSDRLTLLSLTSTSGSIIGYLKEDVNMTGDAKYNGINNDRLVLLQNIGTNSSNTIYEQLPY